MDQQVAAMNKVLLFFVVILFGYGALAQDLPFQKGIEPVALSPQELYVLSTVPELKLPESYKGPNAPLLPVSVDNSLQQYFRPITAQSGYECGQSSGIAFNFCYEIDRLRGVPANSPANQYPTHFTWDFLNNANNYQGASFFDSWEIVRACGNMNVADYGGALNTGGYTRWISGYDKYYNGMANRLNSVKAIRVDSPEGLQTLKYWLYDHLEGAMVGGVGNIYAQYFSPPVGTLPAGTPEAGKYVQTAWGGSPSHGWTICGYNDSIRYDFNGDGQYTNNIDINGDGVVDMHDWEKGGLKFANGYAGLGWGNSGFCYTMYKNLADNIGYGGIWNHTVYVVDVKQTCDPQLTMKVTLKHNSRNKLKVTAGVSNDLSATTPSYVLDFPIFNYQGGDLYMQGGTTEADKTIEFGLDLAPLINQVNSNQPAKYFLQVQEADPSGVASGEIVNWAIIDYTGTNPLITNYPGTNVALQNNTITRLSLNYTLSINKPYITNTTLPPAQIYQPYNATLTANGGTPPYLWDAKLDYPETSQPASFPTVTAQQLTLTNNNSGFAVKNLDFNFPFYKKSVNKVYIYADGYILFDDQPYTWPYLIDKTLLFKQTAIVSPFMSDLAVYPGYSQGVWFEGTPNYAIIRWKVSLYNMQGNTNLNFAVKLFPNGTIEYYYGDMVYPPGTAWTGGLSSGDNKNYQYSAMSNGPSITSNTLDKFTSCGYPPEMEITEDGHFTGTPSYGYQNLPIKFQVTDNNNISTTKTLYLNTYGLLINQTVLSGGDSLIEYGETASISLTLNNIGSQPISQVSFTLTETDPYIQLTDSTEYVATINGGQSLTLANAFTFTVASDIPDKHEFTLLLHVQSMSQGFQRPLNLVAHAPVFHLTGTRWDDGDNGYPDPGESADLLVTYKNAGTSKASGVSITLNSLDTNLIFSQNTASISLLKPDSLKTIVFHGTAGNSASSEHIYPVKSDLSASNGFQKTDTLYLFAGEIVEDFETGNFTKYPWYSTGQWPWIMETGIKYEGNFSTRNSTITDNAESVLNLTATILAPGEVSFYKYVSCEYDPSGSKNYDYLAFFIDNYEMGRWDGVMPWSKSTFPVPAGFHTLSWVYHKDYSISAGFDGALLDYIKLPLIEGAVPSLSVTPLSIERTLAPGQNATEAIQVANLGGGILRYTVQVFDTAANKKESPSDELLSSWVTCGTEGFVPGQAISWMFTVYNQSSDNEYISHVKFDLPPGVVINNATNFSGGSLGELIFQGTTGNGASLNWQGESAGGRGIIKPGETATAILTGTIGEGFQSDVFVVYRLRGDSMGAAPHEHPGNIKVKNYSLANTWVTLTGPTGSLTGNQTGIVLVHMSSLGMPPGTHKCNLIVKDLFNNKFVIPVTMFITSPLYTTDNQVNEEILASPNPFDRETEIRYYLKAEEDVTIQIMTMNGSLVREWKAKAVKAGINLQTWDGKDSRGNELPAGVYSCQMKCNEFSGNIKLILVK